MASKSASEYKVASFYSPRGTDWCAYLSAGVAVQLARDHKVMLLQTGYDAGVNFNGGAMYTFLADAGLLAMQPKPTKRGLCLASLQPDQFFLFEGLVSAIKRGASDAQINEIALGFPATAYSEVRKFGLPAPEFADQRDYPAAHMARRMKESKYILTSMPHSMVNRNHMTEISDRIILVLRDDALAFKQGADDFEWFRQRGAKKRTLLAVVDGHEDGVEKRIEKSPMKNLPRVVLPYGVDKGDEVESVKQILADKDVKAAVEEVYQFVTGRPASVDAGAPLRVI